MVLLELLNKYGCDSWDMELAWSDYKGIQMFCEKMSKEHVI
jgi:hypothetical protein